MGRSCTTLRPPAIRPRASPARACRARHVGLPTPACGCPRRTPLHHRKHLGAHSPDGRDAPVSTAHIALIWIKCPHAALSPAHRRHLPPPLRICMADLESCQCQRRDWRMHPHRAKLDSAGAMKAAPCWRCRNNGCQETIVCAPTYAAEAGPMTPRVPRPGGSTVRATDATPLFGRPPVRQDVRDACHPVAALRAWCHSPWPDTGWRPERSH